MQSYGNNPPPAGSYGSQPPAKKGMSKGCLIGIIVAVVLAVGVIILAVAGGVGFFWLSKQGAGVANANLYPGSTGASSSGADEAEGPKPTDAQKSAVAGGQKATWEQQEISWTVPQRWTKQSASSTSLLWRSPGSWDAANLIVSISPMSADFPTETSINAFYQQAQTRKQQGEVNEVRWLKLDGIKGVMFRESAPESDDDPQRLQWMAYRDYKGQKQLVNIILASRGKDFARHEDALYGILYSTDF